LSTRPARRAGSDAVWDRAEAALAAAARAADLAFIEQPGEGAFYGPKLEFALGDSAGRCWQCGTIQVDFVLPDLLDARYVDEHNARPRPVILHHAVLGSIERFVAMLLEHYAGNLPLWLAPEQILCASIGAEQEAYARRVASLLTDLGYRAALDCRPERLPRKIVDARELGIPILLALGRREVAAETVALRQRDGRQESVALAQLDAALRAEAFR
jgi:threonyl-tRNA synthetase